MVSEEKYHGHLILGFQLPTFFNASQKKCRQTPQMGAAKLTAKFMELMESSPEDQLGDNLKKVMKDGNYQMGGVFFNYIPGSLTFCFDQETMHGIFLEI